MIRPIDINLNAAHPELPLVEATTFVGAPSSVFIRGVPKAVGNWSITAVSVAVTYPDNTTTARAAVESAEGVWVATIPGTATSGRTAAGFKIMADGIDENGAAVTGYVLGFADFSVLSFTPVPAPGGTFYLLRYFDQAPATPKEGDVAKIDGVLKFYNGSAWEPFAAPVPLDDAVTRTSANGVKSSGIWSAIWGALSALPAGFTSLYDWCVAQLAGKEPMFQPSTASGATIKTVSAIVKDGSLLKPITIPTSDMTVNGKALSSDVTLDGEDILVGGSGGAASSDIATAIDDLSRFKAPLDSPTFTGTPVAPTPQDGESSTLIATTAFVQGAVPYNLVTKTISNGAVSLDDRASNSVTISATLSPNTLTINFPTAPTGKLRDFAMRLNIAAGVTAPEIAWPQGVMLENDGGEVPEIADGGTGGSSTILYFSETENNGTTAKFLVKGETLTAIAQV